MLSQRIGDRAYPPVKSCKPSQWHPQVPDSNSHPEATLTVVWKGTESANTHQIPVVAFTPVSVATGYSHWWENLLVFLLLASAAV